MHDDTDHPNHDEHDLLEVESLLRSLTADDLVAPPAPPASIWDGIRAAIDADTAARTASEPMRTAPFETSNVSDLQARRERRGVGGRPILLAAAAVVLLVVGAVTVVATRGSDAEVVASARMAWDPEAFDPLGRDAAATAELVETDDGFEIVLTEADLPADLTENADLELWMIAALPDGSLDVQPVSLVDPTGPGTYAVPADLDPSTYSIVDISIEPRDGDEAHSGRSILRGELSA